MKDPGRLVVDCYIQAQSPKNELAGEYNGRLKIRITAPPVDGKANECLIKFLSKELKISQSDILIVSGFTGKNKRVSFPIECAEHPLLEKFLKGI